MAENEMIQQVIKQSPNRRSFVKKLGIASAALGAVATGAKAQSTITDFDILNFALNLEYLESEFYTYATTGAGIETLGYTVTGTGTAGSTTGGAKVTFVTPNLSTLANQLADDERTHVALLQQSIAAFGGMAIARPAINLNALGFGFGSEADFLKLARIFEDIGITAYAGAAPLIQNTTILGAAARILAVEALHSGSIRTVVVAEGVATAPLDGADIIPPPSGTKFFPVNSDALVETRTPQQVLYLAYNAANATMGGFFPSGVNGTINTSSATPATLDGATLTASPNPVATVDGATTITWNAPQAQVIEIHVGSPTGPLFTQNVNSGSMMTGNWITNGITFYLQDVTGGKALNAANTLATLAVSVMA